MRDILIKHNDGSSIRLAIGKDINGFSKIDTSYFGKDGYYKPELSWSDELPTEDIERQLQNTNYIEY